MMRVLKDFFREEDGLGTVEIVLLIAVLVGLALLFKNQIVGFVAKILGKVVDKDIDPSDIENTKIP